MPNGTPEPYASVIHRPVASAVAVTLHWAILTAALIVIVAVAL